MMNNKAVSEVVGYLLTFSVVVAIVAVVYSAGMPMIEQSKESSVFESMGTSFLAIQSSVKKVAFGQSPIRTTKLNLIKGSISANENAGNITVNGQPFPFGNIEYTLGSRKMVYENGAVIQSTLGGDIIISDPRIFFTNYSGARIFISVINASGYLSAGGGIAEMQMGPYNASRDTHVYNSSSPVSHVNITIESSYAHAWSLFLNNSYRETFGSYPATAGLSDNLCWLKITGGTGGVADKLNLTLVTHNVTIS